jgi:ABC-2 type transport system ATP-binding protein
VTATLAFAHVSRWYGSVIALNDVSLELQPGVTGLLGPNGAGKSTFLRLASGQIVPSQGEVRLLGVPPWGTPAVFHRIGVCPDADAFWDGLTGREFLVALLGLSGFSPAECRTRADAALAEVQLEEAAGRRIAGYSKGMRQRLKLAQALAHDPEVLFLDEPLTGLDPLHRRRVIDLVRRLGREGRTVVVSSHILPEVEAMTHHIVLIHRGRILAQGDIREIRDLIDEHPHTVALRARDPRALAQSIAAWPHVLSLAFGPEGEWLTVQTARPDAFFEAVPEAAQGAGVTEMYSTDDDLESVFRYLVKG